MRAELYLAQELQRAGVAPARLEQAVRETASRIAAEVNQRGLEDQIAYLIDDGLSLDEIRAIAGATMREAA